MSYPNPTAMKRFAVYVVPKATSNSRLPITTLSSKTKRKNWLRKGKSKKKWKRLAARNTLTSKQANKIDKMMKRAR